MGAHFDLVQRTIVLQIAMMRTLLNGTFDGLIRLHIHDLTLLFDHSDSITPHGSFMRVKT